MKIRAKLINAHGDEVGYGIGKMNIVDDVCSGHLTTTKLKVGSTRADIKAMEFFKDKRRIGYGHVKMGKDLGTISFITTGFEPEAGQWWKTTPFLDALRELE
jgi:hypothetical protein